jgi:hypothetical protein
MQVKWCTSRMNALVEKTRGQRAEESPHFAAPFWREIEQGGGETGRFFEDFPPHLPVSL